ncbi:hypothetical protein BC008_43105 [Mastigocoleus testarum BC008]|uniref:Uncharacterized protein n=1 Tax=Mastigocoleus testarum BC008 TaxID=371196 RepID=A0A0V7ZPP2_9CYAN|nr:hypothetical protein BC008_43105 [Mastigocoleus testarum BC008]
MLPVITQEQHIEWGTSKDFSWWHTIVDTLRKILVQNSIELYNKNAKVINYEYAIICGTRIVKPTGEVPQADFPTSPFS